MNREIKKIKAKTNNDNCVLNQFQVNKMNLSELLFNFKKYTGQMPFTKKDLDELPISFAGKDDVWVTIGPCSASFLREYKIPLDGRQ